MTVGSGRTQSPEVHLGTDKRRRDFLGIVTGAVAAVGGACAIWPFIDSMNPAADTLAAGAPIDVDITKILPGQQIIVMWRGKPMLMVRRTQAELRMLVSASDTNLLRDPNSTTRQQPAYAQNWHRSITPEFLVLVGVCTHLGCIPGFKPELGAVGPGWPGGYLCPCHGSRYDLSGRVFKGVPAPMNLPVPPYRFVGNAVIRIGENPPGSEFALSSVEQM